jgi:uncharacterized protein YegJ (DUF2314 family)
MFFAPDETPPAAARKGEMRYRAGDPVEVARDEIEDWMINTGDLRFGGYSVRAMLADMPARQAEALRRQFRD